MFSISILRLPGVTFSFGLPVIAVGAFASASKLFLVFCVEFLLMIERSVLRVDL